jgi:hypothetical protein
MRPIDNAKLGRSPTVGRTESIVGTGGVVSRCVRLVWFIRPR